MSVLLRRLRHAVMGVSDAQATAFSPGGSPTWEHLEQGVLAAVGGYRAVLDSSRTADLVPRLQAAPGELRGYAYEGAAMGLTVLDCSFPGTRLPGYLTGAGADHVYMAHIGAGEALARMRRRPERYLARLPDPVLRWLVLDGFGFHEGFFRADKHLVRRHVPTHLSAHGRRFFDQGLGRSVWFHEGAEPGRVAEVLASFPTARQHDLWVGVGVACTYVGGVPQPVVEAVREHAGRHVDALALGSAFVCKGRRRAGNPTADTDLAARVLCGLSASEAADLVDEAFQGLPGGPEPPYAVLQERLAHHFAPLRRDAA